MTAWKGDYTTLTLLKAHLRIADTADDAALSAVITAASRAIDYECNRQFGVESAQVVRYYTQDCELFIDGRPALAVDDLMTTTDLAVQTDTDCDAGFATTLTNGTDFTLWPYNAALDGRPWTHLVLTPNYTSAYFPTIPRGVKVAAQFGWASVPAVVASAALIQSARFFVRRDSAFGVAGSPDLGSEVRLLERLDPDVALMLTSVKREWGAV